MSATETSGPAATAAPDTNAAETAANPTTETDAVAVPDAPDPDGATPGAEIEPEADSYAKALAAERRRAREAEKRLKAAEQEAEAARTELETERRQLETVQAVRALDLPPDVAGVFPPEMPMEARRTILEALAQQVEAGVQRRLDVLLRNREPERSSGLVPGTESQAAAQIMPSYR